MKVFIFKKSTTAIVIEAEIVGTLIVLISRSLATPLRKQSGRVDIGATTQ